jgi:hypothetical protein
MKCQVGIESELSPLNVLAMLCKHIKEFPEFNPHLPDWPCPGGWIRETHFDILAMAEIRELTLMGWVYKGVENFVTSRVENGEILRP